MRNAAITTPPHRLLMGPGPSNVHPRVLSAMARPTVGHLDPDFVSLMDDIKVLLRRAFQTENELTIPLSAPGSAGMECCFVNLLEPGDTVVVCINGVFGGRMKENAERCGANVVTVESPWGQAVDPDAVKAALKAHPGVKAVAFVHAETSTGVQSDAAAICGVASGAGALSIVDTVTGLGGIPVAVDAWGADAVYSGTQKCLSCPPGLSPMTFSTRAVEAIKARRTKVQSWFLDLSLVMGYWAGPAGGGRSYHHTAPVNALYGLHEALLMLEEEGLEAAWARHAFMHRALVAGLEAMGLKMKVSEDVRLPQLNAVEFPPDLAEANVRRRLLSEFELEIGAGLGPWAGMVWRIGLMGQSATGSHVLTCLAALESVLFEEGATLRPGKAQAAARASLAGDKPQGS
jgi:alanine-glyoxylate transaminase / serine-glyoxylate transaminase / serine-pyruvate transaminase